MEKQPESPADYEPVEVTWDELMQFAIGKATDKVFQRVSQALDAPQHPLHYLTQRGLNNDRAGRTTGTPDQRASG
ncbi:hypothetical protein Pan54_16880 [Rubinisphaera italica]|uniref:Uncharacterized protein n=1 Tax=Rubinisphaera italica TaxID=2527969 RepID=A0A5C5XCZ9_9PLAN|nr:hypothetical protein Pan54_16880 [Rubinisphaera italica]